MRDVWQKTREQRDWFHKLGNILAKHPKRLQPRVKAALHEMMYAETRDQAREAAQRFATEYGSKYPKAVTTLEKDADTCSPLWSPSRPSQAISTGAEMTAGENWREVRCLAAWSQMSRLLLRGRRLSG